MMLQTAWELLLQVTLWSTVGIALLFAANRWWPERLASLAWRFLLGIIVLTVLVWVPWPRWMTGGISGAEHPSVPSQSGDAVSATSTSPGISFSQAWQTWQKWVPAVPSANTVTSTASHTFTWPMALGILAAAGMCLGLWRLLVSYRYVQAQLKASQVIDDQRLLEQCNQLIGKLGIQKVVQLRASPILHVAATVGTWQPVILLPHNWTTWSEAECRTVLAHELAHIQRSDYLMMVLTQLIAIVYWFHPLVGWLSRYMRAGQELAADALAVHVLGDRTSYLQCLARLALVQDGVRLPAPARLFLSPEVSLLRRIAMLREGSRGVLGQGRLLRWGLLGLVMVTGVLIASLRGAIQADEPITSSNSVVSQEWHRYIDAESPGFVVFHPAAFLSLPSMQQHRAFLNLMCKDEFDGLYAKFGMGVPMDAIECVCCNLFITPRKNGEPGTGTMTFSGNYLRFRTAQDADTWLRHCTKNVETIKDESGTYFKTHCESGYVMDGVCFVRPNERTLVFARDDKELKRWLTNAGKPVTKPNWLPAWPTGKEMATAAFNVQHPIVIQSLKDAGNNMPLYPMLKPLFTNTECVQLSASQTDQPVISASLACKSAETAVTQRKQVDALLNVLKIVQASGTTGSTPQKEATDHQELVKIVEGINTVQHEKNVVLTFTSPVPLGTLVQPQIHDMKQRLESVKASEGKK
jgi:beta-lactamase regulating signal transducer with metallopeptidase domain